MQKVILDCDNSFGVFCRDIDDGLALLYLLGSAEVDLLGVTLCYGNTALSASIKATQKLLKRAGHHGLPMKAGSAARRSQYRTEAAEFLADTARRYPGQVSIVATGPLSNLAAASEIDPDFFANLAGINLMGGRRADKHENTSSFGELNLSADPEAAEKVLNADCDVRMFPVDVCLQADFGWRDVARLKGMNLWVQQNMVRWLCCFGLRYRTDRFYLWDLMPAVAISHPALFEFTDASIQSERADLNKGILRIEPGDNHAIATRIVSRESLLIEIFASMSNAAPCAKALRHSVRPVFG